MWRVSLLSVARLSKEKHAPEPKPSDTLRQQEAHDTATDCTQEAVTWCACCDSDSYTNCALVYDGGTPCAYMKECTRGLLGTDCNPA